MWGESHAPSAGKSEKHRCELAHRAVKSSPLPCRADPAATVLHLLHAPSSLPPVLDLALEPEPTLYAKILLGPQINSRRLVLSLAEKAIIALIFTIISATIDNIMCMFTQL